jgi:hypothetical protein
MVDRLERYRCTIMYSCCRNKGSAARERSDVTQPHHRELTIDAGNGEGAHPMRPPLIRRCPVDGIRLGKARDNILIIQRLHPKHYHRCTLTSYRMRTRLLVSRVRLESNGVKGAPQTSPLWFPFPQRTLVLRLRLHLRLVLPHFLLRHSPQLPLTSKRCEKQPCTQRRSVQGPDGNTKRKSEKRNESGHEGRLQSWRRR